MNENNQRAGNVKTRAPITPPSVKSGNNALDGVCATTFRPWCLHTAPVRAFHGAWACFFVAMFASFAPAALTVPIRDTVNLDESDIALGNALTLGGTAFCRIMLGYLCDAYGPKIVMLTMLVTTGLPFHFITLVNEPIGKTPHSNIPSMSLLYLGHVICRPLIGLSMGCQTVSLYWCSSMFSDDIVGAANSSMLGLSEMGYGVAQLLLPAMFVSFSESLEPFVAWRVTLLVPGILQLIVFVYVLLATQDRPDGQQPPPLPEDSKSGGGQRQRWVMAIRNYRTWVFMLLCGIVLGIGLSIYNIITSYYFDNFEISFATAGALGSLAGFANGIYVPLGGYLSDLVSRYRGMRGRLWFAAIDMVALGVALILLSESRRSLTLSIIALQLVIAFVSIFYAALFSLTPFVSHRALGLVQGIVGSGASIIGSVLQEIFFNKSRLETHEGFFWAGVTTLLSTLLLLTIYYPMWGGLLWKPIPDARAIDYYLAEYTEEEIQMGLAEKTMRFAEEMSSKPRRNEDNATT